MKKIITLVAALCLTLPALAQTPTSKVFDPKAGALLDGQTIVKTSVSSMATGSYSLAVERTLNRTFSVQLTTSIHPSSSSIHIVSLPTADIGGIAFDLPKVKLSSFAFTPEIRAYVSKSGFGKGFYFSAYYKYQNFNLDNTSFTFRSSANSGNGGYGYNSVAIVDWKLNTHAFGLGIGAQWFLGSRKNIVIDWYIGGAHAGFGSLTANGKLHALNGNANSLTEQDYQEMRDNIYSELKDLPFIGSPKDGITYDTKNQTITASKISTPWVSLRGSLSLGFRF